MRSSVVLPLRCIAEQLLGPLPSRREVAVTIRYLQGVQRWRKRE